MTRAPVAILFDADGVLQRPREGFADRLAARLDVEEPGQLLQEIFAAEVPALVGGIALREAIEPVLTRWGRAELVDDVLQVWFEIEVDAVVIAAVARLRAAGVRVSLATNQGSDRCAYMRRTLGYDGLFDDQYYSCELGLAKPDPAFFTTILGRLRLTPGEVLFIDDNEANVQAALSVGLRASLFPPHQSVALAGILEANGLVLPAPRAAIEENAMLDLKEELHRKLEAGRATLRAKLEGLGEYDLRRPMTPTGTNLLGLVKHLAGLEYLNFGEAFGRPAPERLSWVDDGSIWQGADMWARPEESSEYITGLYRRACAHADGVIAALGLDAPGLMAHWPEDRRNVTLGFLLVRMVSETAEHAGHADIVRELIDGRGGPDQDMLDEEGWRDHVAGVRAAAEAFLDPEGRSRP